MRGPVEFPGPAFPVHHSPGTEIRTPSHPRSAGMDLGMLHRSGQLRGSRFATLAAILERFVSRKGRPLHCAVVAGELGLAPGRVRAACRQLQRGGLLQHGAGPGQWRLSGRPEEVTLDDVWQLLLAKDAAAVTGRECAPGLDLLLGQAELAVGQAIGRILQTYQLDRVAMAAVVHPPTRSAVSYRMKHDWTK